MTGIPTGELNWWVTFEAVGDNDNTTDATRDTLIRWAMDIPWWDAADATPLYRAALVDRSLDIAGNAIDFRAGRASAGGAAFSLLPTAEVTSIFRRLRHVHTATLATAIDHDDRTIEFSNASGEGTGHAGKIVYLNREVIEVGTGAGPTYTDCVREKYGTLGTPHAVGHKIYERLKVLNRRQVTIGYTPESATSYADEVVFRRFQVEGKGHKMLTGFAFEVDGWLAMLGTAPVLPKQWVGRFAASFDDWVLFIRDSQDMDGEANLPMTMRRPGPRVDLAVDDDIVLVEVAGSIYRGQVTIIRDAADDSLVPHSFIRVELDHPVYSTSHRTPSRDDYSSLTAREVFVSDALSPTNGAIPGLAATAELPLGGSNSNTLTSVMQLLTSTAHGTNGDYDTGIEFGLGIPHTAVDIDAIKSLRDRSSGLEAERLIIGRAADSSAKVLDIIERELRVCGMAFSESAIGKLTIVALEDSELVSVAAITDGDILDTDDIGENFGVALTIDSVAVKWDRYGDGTTRPLVIDDGENTAERLGPDQGDAIDAGSWRARAVVRSRTLAWLNRWRHELPTIELTTGLGTNLHAGQGVSLTSEFVTGVDDDAERSPIDGVTASRCHVVSVSPRLHEGKIDYELLHTGTRYDNLGSIAGTLEVDAHAGGGVVDITDNVFIPLDPETGVTTHPIWTHDTDAFAVDDEVQLLDEFGAHRAYGTVTATGDTTITVAAFTIAVSGDYIVHRDWDNMTASQQSRMAAYAKTNGKVGTADDAGFQYEIG